MAGKRTDMRKGSRVEIRGLQGKPELNGQRGTITAPRNANGRCVVLVDGGTTRVVVAIKPGNLVMVDVADVAQVGDGSGLGMDPPWSSFDGITAEAALAVDVPDTGTLTDDLFPIAQGMAVEVHYTHASELHGAEGTVCGAMRMEDKTWPVALKSGNVLHVEGRGLTTGTACLTRKIQPHEMTLEIWVKMQKKAVLMQPVWDAAYGAGVTIAQVSAGPMGAEREQNLLKRFSGGQQQCGNADEGCRDVGRSFCQGCRDVFYCSRACQKKHWKRHKTACKLARKQLEEQKEKAEDVLVDSASEECPICLSDHCRNTATLGCGHSFCYTCLYKHQAANPDAVCPMCRKTMPDVAANQVARTCPLPHTITTSYPCR